MKRKQKFMKNLLKVAPYGGSQEKVQRSFGKNLNTSQGMGSINPLRKLGDINLWADSRAYNHIENIHQFWLLTVVDLIIGKAEYSANPDAF